MTVKSVDVAHAPSHWSTVMAWLAAGSEVVLTENDTPVARLVPLAKSQGRTPGLHPAALEPRQGFDEPLPDEFWADEP